MNRFIIDDDGRWPPDLCAFRKIYVLSGKLIPKIALLNSWLDRHSEHTVLVTSKWFALVCVVSRPIVNPELFGLLGSLPLVTSVCDVEDELNVCP